MNQNFTLFYRFNKKCRSILLLAFCVLSCKAFAKENVNATNQLFKVIDKTITGVVNDAVGNPLPGVSIKVKGTTKGTMTDGAGKFTLNISGGNTILVISYIGYKTREIPIAGLTNIHISLAEDQSKLNEVVVVGYGSQSRETISTSVAKLDNKVLESVPYANAASALQGTLAGVRAQSTTGQPGEAPIIVIRGGISINNPNGSNPLYIVDGVIRPQLYDINTDDIESMQVLKDAAATSIYGARGANGVIIVTTKAGKAGKFTVNYRSNYEVSTIGKKYDMANAKDYLTLMRLGEIAAPVAKFIFPNRLGAAIGYGTGNDLTNSTSNSTQYLTAANAYKLQQGWQSMPDPVDPTKTLIFSDTNFQDLAFQNAKSYNNYVSVNGGTDKARINAGLGYLANQGAVITTKYNRLTFDLSGDIKARDNLSFSGKLLYTNSSQNNPNLSTANLFYRGNGLAPTAKLYFEDGTLAPGTNSSIGNPLYQLKTQVYNQSYDNITMSLGAHWEILPGLSFDPQVSTFRINSDAYSFQKAFWNGPVTYDTSRGSSESLYKWYQNQADGVFSYNKSISDSHIDAKAGFSYFKRSTGTFSASGRGAATDNIPLLSAASTPTAVASTLSDQLLLGYFAGVNYDYQRKYLVTLNARYDGASSLGNEHKFGFFPGVALGWNVEKEKFWSKVPTIISKFKLRASYGVNGAISDIPDFTAQGVYSVGSTYGGSAGIINSTLPNGDLSWARAKTLNFGTDIGLLNNRVNVILDVYRRVTDNQLTNLTLPNSTGFTTIFTNYGSYENRGIELEVNANILPSKSNVRWNVGFNAAKVKSKVLSLPANGLPNNRVGGALVWDAASGTYMYKGGLQEGSPIGEAYDRKQIGIYATDAEAAKAPTDMNIQSADRTKYGGDTNWLDADGNGIIDSRDQVYMGNIYPTWSGGFSNTVGYKNFEIYIRTDFTAGQMIYNWAEEFMEGNLYGDGNITQRKVDRAWKKQGDVTDMPRMYWGGERVQRNTFNGTATSGSSFYWEKGDFLCIRELTFSYSFPKALLNKVKINGLKLNITANNLHYFTKYSGLNPELGGVDDGRYAMPKNFIFGLNLTL